MRRCKLYIKWPCRNGMCRTHGTEQINQCCPLPDASGTWLNYRTERTAVESRVQALQERHDMRWIRSVRPERQPQCKNERRCAHYVGRHILSWPPAATCRRRAQASGSCTSHVCSWCYHFGQSQSSEPYMLPYRDLVSFSCHLHFLSVTRHTFFVSTSTILDLDFEM